MSSRASAGRSNGTLPQTKICQFKLVLLGDMAVGKSSLVLRFVKGQFDEFQETTIGGEAVVRISGRRSVVHFKSHGNSEWRSLVKLFPVLFMSQLLSWPSRCV